MAIYTCTMNLAIDLFIETNRMVNGKVNRTESDDIQANGKGVNVSLVLKKLGIESTALGFCAGFTGKYILDFIENKGIHQDFIEVNGFSRINVFTRVIETDEEFKLVNSGPTVDVLAQEKLLKKIDGLKKNDYLVVSGSLPRGVSSDIIQKIAEICQLRGVNLILDISDAIIMDCLNYHPYLIKPNEEEIADWFGLDSLESINYVEYCQKLIVNGAQRVLLSLGEKGAIYVDKSGEIYSCNAPKGKVVNTACSGDTLLATVLSGFLTKKTTEETLSYGVAAGSSTAFTQGLTDFSDVKELQKQIVIKKGG